MAKRRSKIAPVKKKAQSSKKPARSEIDDIDLLNAHNYPESMPSSVVAKIRNSRDSQKRLEELLKQSPVAKKSSKKDISAFFEKAVEKKTEQPEEEWEDSDEYEYYEEEEDYEEKEEPSRLKRFFRKKN